MQALMAPSDDFIEFVNPEEGDKSAPQLINHMPPKPAPKLQSSGFNSNQSKDTKSS